jgi:hypothetical protein
MKVTTVARMRQIVLFPFMSKSFLNPEPPFWLFVLLWSASGKYEYRISKRTDCSGLDGKKISRENAAQLLKISKETS